MGRFLAGVACVLLLITGAILLWQGRAQEPGCRQRPPRSPHDRHAR